MLTGKAVQGAFRGLLLVDSTLSAMMVSDEFKVKAPCIAPAQDIIVQQICEISVGFVVKAPTLVYMMFRVY